MDIILAIAPTVIEYTVGPVFRHLSYPFKCKSNVEDRDSKLDKLKATRDMMQHSVDEDKRNGRSIETEVQKWLFEVDQITEKAAGERVKNEEGMKKRCFKIGFCPNFKTRYQLSKKAEKDALIVAELHAQSEFSTMSYRTVPKWMFVSGYKTFQSRASVFDEIMKTLVSPSVNMLGVHGMGGQGKTTLVTQIARQAMEEKLFDMVVMAEVTQTPDVMKIQGQIADMLGLKFEEESERGRAARLQERLKQEKTILVVLDDLWKKVDLEEVGIPSRDQHKGCKILLTSREIDVLSAGMDSQRNFAVDLLPEEEAWDMFRNMAGDNFENHVPQSIAMEVAKECSGLPVAIVTVARALKNKRLPEWKKALRELRRPSKANFAGLQKVVYSCIELSYAHLATKELKSTFLLCSLMKQSASLSNLLKYGVGLGLFPNDYTLEEAQETIVSLVRQLQGSCLLLDNGTNEQLAMHDVVREVAVSIASRDYQVFAANNEVEVNRLDEDQQRRSTQIWLRGNVNGIPDQYLECMKLDLFQVISDNQCLKFQDDRAFEGMQKLKVLNLTNFSFSSLPKSLGLLKNLRTLCLDQSSLGDVAIVGELKRLEILSFVKSDIKYLPREISQLTELKLLDLSDCSQLEVIPPNVISKLSLLEELRMGNSFHQWEPTGENNASLLELENLAHLAILDLHIQDSQLLSADMFSERLERYRIFVGDVWKWDDEYKSLKSLKVKLDVSGGDLEYGIRMLLKRTEDLYVFELKGAKNIVNMLDDHEGFPHLKHFRLHNCHEVQYIVDRMGGAPSIVFPMLESMVLYNLVSLEKICYGSVSLQSFSKLRILEVENCSKLKNLLPFFVAKGLLQLEKIKINDCSNMKEVVAGEGDQESGSNAVIEFPELRSLSLERLLQFRSFVSNVKASSLSQTQPTPLTAEMDSDEIISEDEQQQIPTLFFVEKVKVSNSSN